MRILVIKQDTDLQALSGRLLSAKLSGDQADSALEALQHLNPHADLKKLRIGTVLLVPEAPGFKASATPRTWPSVRMAVTFNCTPSLAKSRTSASDDSPRVLVMGILT